MDNLYDVIIFLPICSIIMYMDMCFACIPAVLTNHSHWSIVSNKQKLLCVMHEIHVFDRKVWFAIIIYYDCC